jgi:hypothetical protein
MRGSVRWSAWVLTGLMVFPVVAACSNDTPKMTNDEAVSRLLDEGYTPESAQCLIDGASKQNVDIPAFLARDKYTQREVDVVSSVGAFCIEHYGSTGTSVPSTGVGSTLAPG